MKLEGQDTIYFNDNMLPAWMLSEEKLSSKRIISDYQEKLLMLRTMWETWTTTELCDTLKMSPTKLNSLFQPVFGPKKPLLSRWAERANEARWGNTRNKAYFYAEGV